MNPSICLSRRVLVAVLLALLASACTVGPRRTADPFGGGGRPAASATGSSDDARSVTVSVRNANFNDATVELVYPTRRRLGRVPGNESREFKMPLAVGNVLGFGADLLGGQQCATPYVEAEPGDRIEVLIDSASRRRSGGVVSMCDAVRRRRSE